MLGLTVYDRQVEVDRLAPVALEDCVTNTVVAATRRASDSTTTHAQMPHAPEAGNAPDINKMLWGGIRQAAYLICAFF
jgi:hypothetical protein